jgi:hypothetical protein
VFLHVACNYHYLGWVLTWKYLKQGFWEKIYIYIRGLHSVQSGVLPVYNIKTNISHPLHSTEKKYNPNFSFFLKEIKELSSALMHDVSPTLA